MPLSHHPVAAQRRRLQERIEAEAIANAAGGAVGIGRNRRHFDPADVVVEREVPDRVEAQRRAGGVLVEAGNLGKAHIDIVAVERPKAEIPHHLGRHLRIVRVEQRKRQPGDVALERAVGQQLHLRRILFGRGFERRRPIELVARHDPELHALLHQYVIAGAEQLDYLVRIVLGDHVAGFYRGLGWRQRAQNCRQQGSSHDSIL